MPHGYSKVVDRRDEVIWEKGNVTVSADEDYDGQWTVEASAPGRGNVERVGTYATKARAVRQAGRWMRENKDWPSGAGGGRRGTGPSLPGFGPPDDGGDSGRDGPRVPGVDMFGEPGDGPSIPGFGPMDTDGDQDSDDGDQPSLPFF